jgi:hypothetical protein
MVFIHFPAIRFVPCHIFGTSFYKLYHTLPSPNSGLLRYLYHNHPHEATKKTDLAPADKRGFFVGARVDNGLARKRSAAQQRRRMGVYNRAAEASVIMVRAGSARSTAVTKWFAERRSGGARRGDDLFMK